MSETYNPSILRTGNLVALRNNLDDLEPFFEREAGETWTVREIDGIDGHTSMGPLKFGLSKGAFERVGKTIVKSEYDGRKKNHRWDKVGKFRWVPEVRAKLEEYREERDELPCGHRLHIYNDPQTEELGCKHCAKDDEHPEYSKEMVQDRL